MPAAKARSRWSARSAARTNDLDRVEARRTMNAGGERRKEGDLCPLHNSGRRCHPGPYEGSDQTPIQLWHTSVMPFLAWRPTLRHQTAARTTPEDLPIGFRGIGRISQRG